MWSVLRKNIAEAQSETKTKDGDREMLFPYNNMISDSKLSLKSRNDKIASFLSRNYTYLFKRTLIRI